MSFNIIKIHGPVCCNEEKHRGKSGSRKGMDLMGELFDEQGTGCEIVPRQWWLNVWTDISDKWCSSRVSTGTCALQYLHQ